MLEREKKQQHILLLMGKETTPTTTTTVKTRYTEKGNAQTFLLHYNPITQELPDKMSAVEDGRRKAMVAMPGGGGYTGGV